MAGDQPAREHAIGGDGDAEFAAGRQDLVLDHARDQRIFDLQIDDRSDRGGAADRRRADLGKPDMADIAGLDQIGDGADGLLDRHVRIEPRGPVDVDVIGPQALQL